jgi:FtsP/CotA-like multicopper oxidase with cupredoxin domain
MKLSTNSSKWLTLAVFSAAVWTAVPASAEICPRPSAGSTVKQPVDLRSSGGVLAVDLHFRGETLPDGEQTFCYLYHDSIQSPTLRLHPGDVLKLTLYNDLEAPAPPAGPSVNAHSHHPSARQTTSCTPDDAMTAFSTNLHFHGLAVSPACHQDEVLHTVVQPHAAAFRYEIHIPLDAEPGLYWYHPHVHGFSNVQVLGGASGAIIIEGMEKLNPLVAGLPERVLVVRDQNLIHPDAKPLAASGVPQLPVLRDAEGDILNTGTGGGKPARDLTLNFVPVAFPEYTPAVLEVQPGKRELWRLLNASSITYLDLQLLFENRPQFLGVVALDGAPLPPNPQTHQRVLWMSHILLPPAGRAEFLLGPLREGIKASFVTRTVDTGPAGENVPSRPLASIVIRSDAPAAASAISSVPGSANSEDRTATNTPPRPWLATVSPAHQRKLYFTESPENPADPNSRTQFFVTVDGQTPALFDPSAEEPNIVVQQGDVEDWIIENRTRELHAFHIHQIHFLLLEWNSIPLDEPILRDTINVGYWDGQSQQFPSVKLRMDFRDPNIIGTFVYHCHLLEHEDGGMMGTIRVDPAPHP